MESSFKCAGLCAKKLLMNSEFLRSGRDFIQSLLSQGVEEVGGFVPPTRLCKILMISLKGSQVPVDSLECHFCILLATIDPPPSPTDEEKKNFNHNTSLQSLNGKSGCREKNTKVSLLNKLVIANRARSKSSFHFNFAALIQITSFMIISEFD